MECKVLATIVYRDKYYTEGDVIEVRDEDLEVLVEAGFIEAPEEKEAPKEETLKEAPEPPEQEPKEKQEPKKRSRRK